MKECPICGKRVYRQQKPVIKKGKWYHSSCMDEKPMKAWIQPGETIKFEYNEVKE